MKKKLAAQPLKEKKSQAWLTAERLRYYPLLLGLVVLAATFVVLVNYESDYLYFVQELNLFLYTPLFLKQQLVVAGGFLTYLGTYFTQFFYHPWSGVLWLCLWCGVLMWLTCRAFDLSARLGVLVVVPLALVLLTDFDLGYWIYLLKLRGHFFITAIGTSIALASVWAYRKLPSRHGLRLAFMVLASLLLYPTAGAYGLLATVLMGVISWRLEGDTLGRKALATLLSVLLVVVVPFVFYRYVYYQTSTDRLWREALPLFELDEPYNSYYWPYALLALFLVLLALTYREQWSQCLLRKPLLWGLSQLVVAGAVGYGCWHYWYKDDSFRRELKMQIAIEQTNWNGVLAVAASNPDEPTRTEWMYKNLAIFKLGRAGNEMYNYRNGSKKPECSFSVPIVVQGGKQLYLYYGLPNYCYRWCMEDGVEYGWRVLYLKYLVRSSLLNGESVLARKYIDVLKQTRYYRDLALHYEQLALHPEKLAKDQELGPVQPLLNFESMLASDQSVVETFLLTLLSTQRTTDPLKAELAMTAALQQKSIPIFWDAFFQYANLHPNQPMPRHYQEAAYMFGHLEHNVDISRMPFDPSIPDSYKRFMQMAKQYAGMKEAQLAQIMRPYFGNTYYFDYFLMRELKTY